MCMHATKGLVNGLQLILTCESDGLLELLSAIWPSSLPCRCIQAEHFGKLALPVAEFLALTHDTAYAGYAASGPDSLEKIQEEPFFGVATAPSSSPPPSTSPRKSSSAHKPPSSPGRKPKSPSKAATAQLDRINTGIHDAVMRPITCTPMSTLKNVSRPFSAAAPTHLFVRKPSCWFAGALEALAAQLYLVTCIQIVRCYMLHHHQ